jgi:hypothetical protein
MSEVCLYDLVQYTDHVIFESLLNSFKEGVLFRVLRSCRDYELQNLDVNLTLDYDTLLGVISSYT